MFRHKMIYVTFYLRHNAKSHCEVKPCIFPVIKQRNNATLYNYYDNKMDIGVSGEGDWAVVPSGTFLGVALWENSV